MLIRKAHSVDDRSPFEKGGKGVLVVDRSSVARLTPPCSPSFRGGDDATSELMKFQLKVCFADRREKFTGPEGSPPDNGKNLVRPEKSLVLWCFCPQRYCDFKRAKGNMPPLSYTTGIHRSPFWHGLETEV